MDVATDLPLPDIPQQQDALSYDDSVAYEQQVPTTSEEDPRSNPLASRIGNTKIYLLSEASAAARSAKRKFDEDEEVVFEREKPTKDDDEEGMDEDLGYRANAILLQGSPISHLPTARLFAYAKHFDTTPLGLEWVNDNTCILVYESNSLARTAFTSLQKSSTELPDTEDFTVAKPIPLAIWPPEERINNTLGMSDGLKGVVKMRWARFSDVKKKGAKRASEFYKKHGTEAGKELFNGRDLPPTKRARTENDGRGDVRDKEIEKLRLDAELDQFLQDSDEEKQSLDEPEPPSEPPSRMRSDYIASDGRTLLDRFSDPSLFETEKNPAERLGLKDRLTVPLPRRARGVRGSRRQDLDPESDLSSDSLWKRLSPSELDREDRRYESRGNGGRRGLDRVGDGRRRGGRTGGDRPTKTQQELDDELDAFLKQD